MVRAFSGGQTARPDLSNGLCFWLHQVKEIGRPLALGNSPLTVILGHSSFHTNFRSLLPRL